MSSLSSEDSSISSSSGSSSESEPEIEKKVEIKKKRAPKRKKPTGPKKPLTGFMFFSKESRAGIKAENPEATFAELGRLVGSTWRNLTDEQKAPYQEKSNQDKLRYRAEMALVDPSTLPQPKKKKKKNTGPKRPLSSYMFFSRAVRKTVQQENPDAKFAEIGKLLGQRWKSLSMEDKRPYIELNSEDKVRYQREMEEHKEKEAQKAKQAAKEAAEAESSDSGSDSDSDSDSGSASASASASASDSSDSGSESDDEEEE